MIEARARRMKVFHPAELRWNGRATRAHLLNLSATGAMLTTCDPPAEGTHLTLCDGRLRAFARVVWRKGRQCGIAFVEALDEIELQGVIEAQRTLIASAFARREPACSGEQLRIRAFAA